MKPIRPSLKPISMTEPLPERGQRSVEGGDDENGEDEDENFRDDEIAVEYEPTDPDAPMDMAQRHDELDDLFADGNENSQGAAVEEASIKHQRVEVEFDLDENFLCHPCVAKDILKFLKLA